MLRVVFRQLFLKLAHLFVVHFIAPNPANITAVAAPAPGALEVRWVNPSKANGYLSSSRAIARPKEGGSEVTCNGTTEAETNCSLTGLRNFTEYEVWVVVCTASEEDPVPTEPPQDTTEPTDTETVEVSTEPPQDTTETTDTETVEVSTETPLETTDTQDVYTETTEVFTEPTGNYIGLGDVHHEPLKEDVFRDAAGGGCTNSSPAVKRTIPTAPDAANIMAVAAPSPGTLEVRWVNPSKANGNLSSSRAIARPKDGGSGFTCSGTAEASSATNCSLTGLRNFTEYEVWVQVCTAPREVEVEGDVAGGGCTHSSVKTKRTIPTAPDAANITAVAAPSPGTLEVRWVNPNKANGNLSSSRAIARPKDGGSGFTCSGTAEASSATECSLTGLRNFTEYDVWVEVCTAPAKVEVDGEATGVPGAPEFTHHIRLHWLHRPSTYPHPTGLFSGIHRNIDTPSTPSTSIKLTLIQHCQLLICQRDHH
ncbi:Usher syndrome 2A (autosomal recessive, mild) [Sparganum proliferum]